MRKSVTVRNDPRAVWMGLLAFASFNLTIGSMWGSFGVLLTAIEAKTGVTRDLSSLPAPLVMIGVASLGPVVGTLAAKMSIRLLLMAGSLLGALGYALLASAHTIQVMLLAYGLLVGPSVCLCGAVLPATLVTRWFTEGRGRAVGIAHMPIVVSMVPLLSAFLLRSYGLSVVYWTLCGFMSLNFVLQCFVIDHPRAAEGSPGQLGEPTAVAPPVGGVWRHASFWTFTIGYAANIAGTITLSAHLDPMALRWGVSPTQAAELLAIMPLAGIVGPLVFGWLADKIGGRRTIAILCLDSAVLWMLLLLHPAFPALVVIIGLFGLHSAGAVPSFAVAIAEHFGSAMFSRAYGLANMATLPFTILSVPLAAWIYVRSGSYTGALLIQIAFFLAASLAVILIGRRPTLPAAGVEAMELS